MATTTNFGWETPDDTDLVKDGAAAMRTLGNSIDASFVDLKGGTTGQVLSKNSNTDLDFTWVAQDDSNAIQNSIVDAKGDLIAASAADTPARLAVGNDGETLVADSSTSTGLRWQPVTSQNACYNSSFDVWQRGTSFTPDTTTSQYTADRWQTYSTSATGRTISRQSAGSLGTTPSQIATYACRVARNSGNTNTGSIYIFQTLENSDAANFIGKTITLSFYARCGANYSPTSSLLAIQVRSATTTDQNYLNMATGTVNDNATVTLTTSWQRFSKTFTLGTGVNQFGWGFYMEPTGTAGANDWFEVTGVQMELGSVATPYKRMSATLAGELLAAQRYYYRTSGNGGYRRFGAGQCYGTGNVVAYISFPVTMRTNPTALEQSGTASHYAVTNSTAGPVACNTVPSFDNANNNGSTVLFTTASGLTAGNATTVMDNNTSSAYLGWSAEL